MPPAAPAALWPRRSRSPTSAHLHVDFVPGLVCERGAALFLQLLQDAAVDGQAAVDFCQELFDVRVEGAQDAVTDLCELRTRGRAEWPGPGPGSAGGLPGLGPDFTDCLQSLLLNQALWGNRPLTID